MFSKLLKSPRASRVIPSSQAGHHNIAHIACHLELVPSFDFMALEALLKANPNTERLIITIPEGIDDFKYLRGLAIINVKTLDIHCKVEGRNSAASRYLTQIYGSIAQMLVSNIFITELVNDNQCYSQVVKDLIDPLLFRNRYIGRCSVVRVAWMAEGDFIQIRQLLSQEIQHRGLNRKAGVDSSDPLVCATGILRNGGIIPEVRQAAIEYFIASYEDRYPKLIEEVRKKYELLKVKHAMSEKGEFKIRHPRHSHP